MCVKKFEQTNRVHGKDFLEVPPNGIHRGPDGRFKEPCHFFPARQLNVSVVCVWLPADIPCQSQLSSVNPLPGVVVPHTAEFDILRRSIIGKHSFQTTVELLGEGCDIFRCIES